MALKKNLNNNQILKDTTLSKAPTKNKSSGVAKRPACSQEALPDATNSRSRAIVEAFIGRTATQAKADKWEDAAQAREKGFGAVPPLAASAGHVTKLEQMVALPATCRDYWLRVEAFEAADEPSDPGLRSGAL